MLSLVTLGNVQVIARRVGSADGRGKLVLSDQTGRQLAVLTFDEVRGLGRVWEIRPGEDRWTLGPVEIARLKALVGPAGLLRRAG